MKDMLDGIGIKEFMDKLDLPEKGSNRGYEPTQIIECFWTSIWIGAGRFSHSAYLRYDKVLHEIFGWKQAPSWSGSKKVDVGILESSVGTQWLACPVR